MRKCLDGNWLFNGSYLEQFNKFDLEATVPGSIYNDLLNNKLIEDPFYRANEVKMLDLMNYDYSYSRKFIITKEELNKEINLVFLGLDTICEIYVNNKLVKLTYNMHRRYLVNINDYVNVGENELKVVIKSCLDFIKEEYKKIPCELMNMQYAVKGYATIRKAHCMFGWDWGPQMPDGGIWRSVYLELLDKARINEVTVFQDILKDKANLKVKVNNYLLKDNLKVKLELRLGDYNIKLLDDAKADNLFEFSVDNPKLWYPVGYGKQELYELTVTILDNEEVVDCNKQKIGLRTMEVKRVPDEYGESFTVTVNDLPIFIKGSDYIIEDNILSRADINHTKFLLNAALEGNQNCLRIWGGALYPSDEFYNLCDELGILIWQDLMFACGYYNMENENFVSEIKEEILDNVSRIHNHPCLILICGNNENETAALDWHIPSFEYTKKWYLYQYEELIPELLKQVAPDIFYWPSSPSSGGGFNKPNSDSHGDMHYWGVWHGNEPIENYRNYFPRMLSEFGMQSFPPMKTIEKFTLPDDRNIYSFVMERHQKNRSANQKIMNYIGSMFKYPKNLEYISYVSELIQAEAVRYCVEHLRRNYGRCMGAIYWQLNDCWPVASWSSIDYYDRYKALQYYSKRFYQPILVSIEEKNTLDLTYTVKVGHQSAKIVLTNETNKALDGVYTWYLYDFNKNVIAKGKDKYIVDCYSVATLATLEFDLPFEVQTNCVLKVYVKDNNHNYLATNEVSFVRDKYLQLQKPNIKYELTDLGDRYQLKLLSDTYAKYVFVDLANDDVIFSDNYFSLLKDEDKVITFKKDKLTKKITEKDIKIVSLVDSY